MTVYSNSMQALTRMKSQFKTMSLSILLIFNIFATFSTVSDWESDSSNAFSTVMPCMGPALKHRRKSYIMTSLVICQFMMMLNQTMMLKQIKMNFNYHNFTKSIVIVFAPPCPPPLFSNLRIRLKHRCECECDIYALSPAHASALQRMFQRFSAYFSAINIQQKGYWS